jgi:hypothetical protein
VAPLKLANVADTALCLAALILWGQRVRTASAFGLIASRVPSCNRS